MKTMLKKQHQLSHTQETLIKKWLMSFVQLMQKLLTPNKPTFADVICIRVEYIVVLNKNKEIDSEKTKIILINTKESKATKKKIEKKPLLISFLSVLEEKNLTRAVESANEATAVKSETVTVS